MQLYEAEGKAMLRAGGFNVPAGQLAFGANDALQAARSIGFPCVLKAQTLSGKRWKRGLVSIVSDENSLLDRIKSTDGEPIAGFLIEEQIRDAKEFYLSVSIAEAQGNGVLMISLAGGVDVEESHHDSPHVKLSFRGRRSPSADRILDALRETGIRGATAIGLARSAERLVRVALQNECILAEINPLFVKADGSAIAADAKVETDDDARGDHDKFVSFKREQDPIEREAAERGISFVRLDGDIGTLVGGAGLAMLTMDALRDANLQPANFTDLQGSSTNKFVAGFELLAKIGGIKAVLTNNAGGLNPCSLLAEGIVEGAKRLSSPIPIVVKLHGSDEAEAWAHLQSSGPNFHVCRGTTAEAVQQLRSLL
jgi:succinyl-CoA synthetase beta subunit